MLIFQLLRFQLKLLFDNNIYLLSFFHLFLTFNGSKKYLSGKPTIFYFSISRRSKFQRVSRTCNMNGAMSSSIW